MAKKNIKVSVYPNTMKYDTMAEIDIDNFKINKGVGFTINYSPLKVSLKSVQNLVDKDVVARKLINILEDDYAKITDFNVGEIKEVHGRSNWNIRAVVGVSVEYTRIRQDKWLSEIKKLENAVFSLTKRGRGKDFTRKENINDWDEYRGVNDVETNIKGLNDEIVKWKRSIRNDYIRLVNLLDFVKSHRIGRVNNIEKEASILFNMAFDMLETENLWVKHYDKLIELVKDSNNRINKVYNHTLLRLNIFKLNGGGLKCDTDRKR